MIRTSNTRVQRRRSREGYGDVKGASGIKDASLIVYSVRSPRGVRAFGLAIAARSEHSVSLSRQKQCAGYLKQSACRNQGLPLLSEKKVDQSCLKESHFPGSLIELLGPLWVQRERNNPTQVRWHFFPPAPPGLGKSSF